MDALSSRRWPVQDEAGSFSALRWIFLSLFSLSSLAHAQDSATENPIVPLLTQLFWALALIGVMVVTGIIWAGMVRRGFRQQSETIQQREAALEEHYQELFDNAHDIIYTHDLDGNSPSLNKAGEQILGYSRSEAAKLNFAQMVAPKHHEFFQDVLRRLKTGEARTNCELEMLTKNGRRLLLNVNLRVQQRGGNPIRIQGIAWDVTERKEAEEALRESEHRLRRSVEERERIGRDLHDGIIQSIYAIGLGLADCRRLLKEDPQQAESRLAKSIADLNGVIREVRNFIVGLKPETLNGRDFERALESLVSSLSETGGGQFSFSVDPGATDLLKDSQTMNLLQIAREALSNSLRHARAQHTRVSLQMQNGSVRLEVSDDGVGFNPKAADDHGHGLRNMIARAQELGARSEVISAPGKGTRVVIEIPQRRNS